MKSNTWFRIVRPALVVFTMLLIASSFALLVVKAALGGQNLLAITTGVTGGFIFIAFVVAVSKYCLND